MFWEYAPECRDISRTVTTVTFLVNFVSIFLSLKEVKKNGSQEIRRF
jgi:hypothetical protein